MHQALGVGEETRLLRGAYQGKEVPHDLRVGDVDPASQLVHGYLRAVVELQGNYKEKAERWQRIGRRPGGGGEDRGGRVGVTTDINALELKAPQRERDGERQTG